MNVHPQSFRALAYEVRNLLTAGRTTDDTQYSLSLIEQELRNQTGKYYQQFDKLAEREGKTPDVARLVTDLLNVTGYGLDRVLPIDQILFHGGKCCISFLGIAASGRAFTPCQQSWQLIDTAALNKRPAYCVTGDKLRLRLTPETVLIDHVDITYIPANGFPNLDRSDEWYWAQPWNVSPALKAEVKLQTLLIYSKTHVLLAGRADVKNNGVDQ